MYQPVRKFIDSFKEGQIVRPVEFARSFTPEMSEGDKARQLCFFHEIAEKELLRFNAFEFYKPLTTETEFIKKTNEEYIEFVGKNRVYVSYAYYVERWIVNAPEGCFFTEHDICNSIPGIKPANSTIRSYLNKAVNEDRLFRYSTDKGRYFYKDSLIVEKIPSVEKIHYNEIQQLFIDFLKKRKAFDKFVENLSKTCRFEDSQDPIRDMLTADIRPTGWISEFIIWSETPEGFKFWEKIHHTWCVALIKHFRPKLGAVLEQLIKLEEDDVKRYFINELDDAVDDLLFTEGWDLTKCTTLI